MVNEAKYIDLANMVEKVWLFEMDSVGDYYTWSNKQTDKPYTLG